MVQHTGTSQATPALPLKQRCLSVGTKCESSVVSFGVACGWSYLHCLLGKLDFRASVEGRAVGIGEGPCRFFSGRQDNLIFLSVINYYGFSQSNV